MRVAGFDVYFWFGRGCVLVRGEGERCVLIGFFFVVYLVFGRLYSRAVCG